MVEEFDPALANDAVIIEPVAPEKKKRGYTRKNTSKAKREERTQQVERTLAYAFAALIGWYYTSKDMPEECEPTEDEAYSIVRPLTNIYDRHTGDLPEVSEDWIDAGMFVVSLLIYSRRVAKIVQENRKQREYQQSIPYSAPQNGYTVNEPETRNTVSDDSKVRKTRKTKTNHASTTETNLVESSIGDREQPGSEQSDDPIANLLRRDADARHTGQY